MTEVPSKRRSRNRPFQDRTDTRDTRETISVSYNRENIRRNTHTHTHIYIYIYIYSVHVRLRLCGCLWGFAILNEGNIEFCKLSFHICFQYFHVVWLCYRLRLYPQIECWCFGLFLYLASGKTNQGRAGRWSHRVGEIKFGNLDLPK